MNLKTISICAMALLGLVSSLSAVRIVVDYRYDTNNFFDTEEKRDAIEAVADYYSRLFSDKLLRIDASDFEGENWTARLIHPSTEELEEIPNLIVPEDVIFMFVGGRDIEGRSVGRGGPAGYRMDENASALWIARLEGRGNPGAATPLLEDRTDFAPWGGTLTFDDQTNWNFSLSENRQGLEFVSVAIHEMGHALGFSPVPSYENQRQNDQLNGPATINSFGSAPRADFFHFRDRPRSSSVRFLNREHGEDQPAMMNSSINDNGSEFRVLTDLDLAVFSDIGWEVNPEVNFRTVVSENASPTVEYDSVSFKNYQIKRTNDLNLPFQEVTTPVTGTGKVDIFNDPNPLARKAFYQLDVTPSVIRKVSQNNNRVVRTKDSDSSGEQKSLIRMYPRVSCECH